MNIKERIDWTNLYPERKLVADEKITDFEKCINLLSTAHSGIKHFFDLFFKKFNSDNATHKDQVDFGAVKNE